MTLNIYLIEHNRASYGEYDGFVIAAATEQEARDHLEASYNSSTLGAWFNTWPDRGEKTAELVGTTEHYTETTEIMGSLIT